MLKTVLITGVSTGIGYATTQRLLDHGYQVLGSVRKRADAERLRSEFNNERFIPLLFDVTDPAAIQAAAAEVAALVDGRGLAGLVNNAGVAMPGPVLHISVDEFRQQFEVNFFGLIAVTQAFLPLLGARRNCPHPPGRIVNISSVSGRMASPFLSPYSTSKHALEALTDSLRRELLIYGIDAISVQPGPIRTPIWDKAEQLDVERFANTDYYPILKRVLVDTVASGRKGRTPEEVARLVQHALEHPHPRPHLALPQNWLLWGLLQTLPARWVDRLIARRLGLTRL
jgi:NAD(P)-dependent dehydrogenase (short-subunit alcohol dehydrogenase family)